VVEVLGGDEQDGSMWQWLPLPVRVVVRDGRGNGVPDAEVAWTVLSGEGHVHEARTRSDHLGIATNYWAVGSLGAPQEMRAEVSGARPATFRARSVYPPELRVQAAGQPLYPDTVGRTLRHPAEVLVLDEFGNPATGIRVEWAAAHGSGALAAEAAHTNEEGRAAAIWTLGLRAGVQVAYAIVDGLPPAELRVTAHPGEARWMSAWHLGPAYAGLSATPLIVQTVARDAHGNKIPEGITWSAKDPAAAVIEEVIGTEDTIAQATVRMKRAGAAELVASVGTLSEAISVETRAFRSAALNGHQLCAIEAAGTLLCWPVTQLTSWSGPPADLRDAAVPTPLLQSQQFASVEAGARHWCALTPTGALYCWGENDWGAAGAGSTVRRVTHPTKVLGEHTFQGGVDR
jgi:hypothetical protein